MTDWANLPAEEKVGIVTAMGFRPTGTNHDPECPRMLDRGLRCNCVPPATLWAQPHDVSVLRRETWPERLDRARARTS